MSDLSSVAQNISNLVTNTDDVINQVNAYKKQINEMIASVNSLINGTSRQGYKDLINQLLISQKKLEFASDCLANVSRLGKDWLSGHITGTSKAVNPSTYDFATSLDQNYGDNKVDENEDFSGEENPKVKKITKEEADERYKNGLKDIDERLENHKEALMRRGVPNGEWLRKTLAMEKALMIQQLANDIEVARGQAQAQDIYNLLESGEDGSYKFYDDMAQSYFAERAKTGPCIDWKTQPESNKTNISLNLSKTNPNYEPSTEWSINCQRCVPTYEMRRRGYDVTAFPKLDPNDYLCRHPFDVWENPDVSRTAGSGKESIVERMLEWGDGARAQIVVVWRGVPSGHTFIAENVGGEVRFIDPQTGDEDVSRYFNRVADNQTLFCRIDDLTPSDYILQCSREV